jgi:hypothetical protein
MLSEGPVSLAAQGPRATAALRADLSPDVLSSRRAYS